MNFGCCVFVHLWLPIYKCLWSLDMPSNPTIITMVIILQVICVHPSYLMEDRTDLFPLRLSQRLHLEQEQGFRKI